MKEESQNPAINPELEARIVALVLGEASDFERDQLSRLIETHPELAALKEQIQSVHGLLHDVGTGETVADDDDWKLSAEKRSAVLAVIGGESEEQSAGQAVHKITAKRRLVKRNFFWSLTKIAAVFCVVGFFGSIVMLALVNHRLTDSARFRQLAFNDNEAITRDFKDAKTSWGAASAPPGEGSLINDETITAAGEGLTAAARFAEFNYENNSKSALSAIRDSLGADANASTPIDNEDLPATELDIRFDAGSFGATTPSFGGSDAGAASTEGGNGPEPSSQQTAGYPQFETSLIPFPDDPPLVYPDRELWQDLTNRRQKYGQINLAKDAAEQSGDLDGDGYRSANSQPTGQEPVNVELSLPSLSDSSGQFNAAGKPGPTISVPDRGTTLRGGVKRLPEGRSELGISGEAANSSPMTRDDSKSDSRGQTLHWSNDREAVLRLVDRPIVGGKADGSGLAAIDEIEKISGGNRKFSHEQESTPGFSSGDTGIRDSMDERFDIPISGDESTSSHAVLPQSKGANLTFPAGGGDSLATGDVDYVEGIEVYGGLGGGGYGGGGGGFGEQSGVSADEFENEISAASQPQGISPAPSQPRAAGMDGRRSAMDADEPADELFDTNGPRAQGANSQSGRTRNVPMAADEYFKRNGELASPDRHKEELAKDSVITPGDDDLTLPETHRLNGAFFYSEPVTGSDIGQPKKQNSQLDHDQESNRSSGRLSQDFGTSPPVRITLEEEETDQWATITRSDVPQTAERVKSLPRELSNRSKLENHDATTGVLLSDDGLDRAANKDVGQYWHRPQSELKATPAERTRYGDRLAIKGLNVWRGYVPPMLDDDSKSVHYSEVDKAAAPAGLHEKTAEVEAFSTFSLHVSDVSFKLAQAALARGEWPEAAKIRIEEFVNAFDYGDPMPNQSEKVACCLEQSVHLFLQQRNLLRVSMRTAATGRSSSTPLRLTLLLDNSGSMERTDRQQTVRRAFALLAQQLKPIDQVTLISFARQPRLLADKVSGAQSQQLVQLIDNLPSEGGTNIEAALQLAFEKAREQQVDGAQNRIILLTDGAVNLGDANPASLSQMITTMRNAGIAFDAAGISTDGLNDEILEALTRKGDGRYYVLDALEAADDGFARQIAGALRPSAKNVKVQIEFNPKRVGRYKLLGFEKHRLKQEDFRNDKVDAAELAAAEAGVAVYQFEAKPDGEGDVGSVSVRFRDLSTGQMIENRWPIPYEADAPRPDQAAPSLRIATSAALLAAKLRGEPLGEIVDLKTLSDLIAGLPEPDRNANRVLQLQRMIQQARQMSGE